MYDMLNWVWCLLIVKSLFCISCLLFFLLYIVSFCFIFSQNKKKEIPLFYLYCMLKFIQRIMIFFILVWMISFYILYFVCKIQINIKIETIEVNWCFKKKMMVMRRFLHPVIILYCFLFNQKNLFSIIQLFEQ